jgi:hypothetical protein
MPLLQPLRSPTPIEQGQPNEELTSCWDFCFTENCSTSGRRIGLEKKRDMLMMPNTADYNAS